MEEGKKTSLEVEQSFWDGKLQDETGQLGAFTFFHSVGEEEFLSIEVCVDNADENKKINLILSCDGRIGIFQTIYKNGNTREDSASDLTVEQIIDALGVYQAVKIINSVR